MKLLVAASNEPLARAIRGTLLGAQHEVDQTGTREDTLTAIIEAMQGGASEQENTPAVPYDAIVLDEDLVEPQHDDFVVKLRAADSTLKILLLATTPLSRTIGDGNRWRALPHEYAPIEQNSNLDSANSTSSTSSESDQSALAEDIATNQPDAVLRKPFSDTELLSYVNALAAGSPTMIIRGNLTLDTTHRKAYYASTHSPITLSRLEYSLLEALVKANGEFVNTKELVGLVGGPYFEQQGLLRNALYTLDKKLTRAGLIMTQRGSNYRIR